MSEDKPLPEDEAIHAAFPTRSGRHDLYAEAQRLVGAKHSKAALVELVNWLLHRCEGANMKLKPHVIAELSQEERDEVLDQFVKRAKGSL